MPKYCVTYKALVVLKGWVEADSADTAERATLANPPQFRATETDGCLEQGRIDTQWCESVEADLWPPYPAGRSSSK